MPDDDFAPPSENQCSKCKALLPADNEEKQCEKCRCASRLSMQKKQKREQADEGPPPSPATGPGSTNSQSTESKKNVAVKFTDKNALLKQLKNVFKTSEHIFFHGCYDLPADPLSSDKAYVKAAAHEIWRVTGYRFTVKDNQPLKSGHKTRYWCCQDAGRKKEARPSQSAGVKHRDTLGMRRFNCKSKLNISCRTNLGSEENAYTIIIWLEHHARHIPYYDVSLPPEASALICENLEWICPSEIAKKVQSTYPFITTNQVHTAWTTMSETLWKRGAQQIPSVRTILGELQDDVAILDLLNLDGVEHVAWVMKKIALPLRGQIVKIGMDATYNTNSKHLELYNILGEYDNTGFPLSYCLLTTAASLEDQKRTRVLESWGTILHDVYGLLVADGAGYSARGLTLSGGHSVSLEDPPRFFANNPAFDGGGSSLARVLGGRSDTDVRNTNCSTHTSTHPIPLAIHIPQDNRVQAREQRAPPDNSKLVIRIPAPSTIRETGPVVEDEPDADEETTCERHTFCPIEHRTTVVEIMERHFCAHPLIPGYSAPTPEGIKAWAVKQIYEFCVQRELPNLWAYLWENWYRCGRWELWARSVDPREIPWLKTTMLVEGRWRRVKGDYVYHFSLPRLDLLALLPRTAEMEERLQSGVEKSNEKAITVPLNERYRLDVKRFVCTCLQFIVSRFLICKHLVQLFHPVNPRFFLEVTRNRTLPFWSHPSLKPISISTEEIEVYQKAAAIGDENDEAPGEPYSRVNTVENDMDDFNFESEDNDALIDTWESGVPNQVPRLPVFEHITEGWCKVLPACAKLSQLRKEAEFKSNSIPGNVGEVNSQCIVLSITPMP
ncbi:hypothetical protein V8E53_008568 [Lactarius tabidus]